MKMIHQIAVLTTLMNLSGIDGARILAVFPLPAFSHQMVYRDLMKELHNRGHEIVIVTSFPMRNSNFVNYTEIDISNTIGLWKNNVDYHKTKEHELSLYRLMIHVSNIFIEICSKVLGSPEVLSLIRNGYKNGSFDLVITSWLLNPCVTGFAYHFSAPLLGISTLGLTYSGHNSIGNPTHPVYFTEAFNPYLKNPTYWQKLNRLAYYVWNMWHWDTYVVQPQDRIARRYFGENMPYLQELHDNVSLVFTALQTSHHCVVPKVPALIELGPIHLKEAKPLPKDLQRFLDGAPAGAIYFSFGTSVRIDKMSSEKINLFMEVFSQLPDFRILWKWDGEEIPNLPANVRTGKWFSQLDVLAYPKMKVFIYQGGLQSTEEAIKFHVPVIGFPFAVDQDLNLRRLVDYGAGIKMNYNTITKDSFFQALKSVIYDPRYKANMKRLSDISNDQPQTPMERAVWWTEYVIRHKGAPHMRSAAMDLTWYQYLLLDVLLFLIALFILMAWATCYLFNRISLYMKEKEKFH